MVPKSHQNARKKLGFESLFDTTDPNVDEVDDVIGLCSQSQGQFLTQKPIADTQSTQKTQETQQKEDQGEEESQLIVESTPDTVIMTQNQSSQSQMLSQTDFQSSANTLTGKFYLDF